jgi:hypothetical protein
MARRWIRLHLDLLVMPIAAAGLIVLSGHTDVSGAAGDTFTAAMTVLVFLLPSTSLLGGYLTNAIDTTSRSVLRAKDDTTRTRRANVARSHISRLLDVAGPLRRAIVYTTAAVVLSGTALFNPGGGLGDFRVTELLIALAVVLLISTAFTVLPATSTVLEYRQAREYVDTDLAILAQPRPQPAPEANGQAPVEPQKVTNPKAILIVGLCGACWLAGLGIGRRVWRASRT